MHEALEELGHPELRLRTVQVGGTNGKGSTCAFLEAILRAGRPPGGALHLAAPDPGERAHPGGRRGRSTTRRSARASSRCSGARPPRAGATYFELGTLAGPGALRAGAGGRRGARGRARRPARRDHRLRARGSPPSPASGSTTWSSSARRWPPSPGRRRPSSGRACRRWSSAQRPGGAGGGRGVRRGRGGRAAAASRAGTSRSTALGRYVGPGRVLDGPGARAPRRAPAPQRGRGGDLRAPARRTGAPGGRRGHPHRAAAARAGRAGWSRSPATRRCSSTGRTTRTGWRRSGPRSTRRPTPAGRCTSSSASVLGQAGGADAPDAASPRAPRRSSPGCPRRGAWTPTSYLAARPDARARRWTSLRRPPRAWRGHGRRAGAGRLGAGCRLAVPRRCGEGAAGAHPPHG